MCKRSNLNVNELDPASETADELHSENKPLFDDVQKYLKAAARRKRGVLYLIQNNNWMKFLELPNYPLADLEQRAADLQKELDSIQSPCRLKKWNEDEAEYRELEARCILNLHKAEVLGRIEFLSQKEKLQACSEALNPQGITGKAKNLTGECVAEKLGENLQKEMNELGVSSVPVDLNPSGSRGVVSTAIRLKGIQSPISDPSEILSEGEERALAIAAFLAEIKTNHHLSGIIFDDPVSSLDHEWRDRVAARLVKESQYRQVIIFTHDIYFWFEIKEQAEDQGLGDKISHQFIESRGDVSGVRLADGNQPIQIQDVDKIIKTLKDTLKNTIHKKLRAV